MKAFHRFLLSFVGVMAALLGSTLGTETAQAEGFGRARELLKKVYAANPRVKLEGKVTTEGPYRESGPGVMRFRYPSEVSFQYYGTRAFDFRLAADGIAVTQYPKSRAKPGVTTLAGKVEAKVGEWLWSTLVSLKERPLEDFLIARLFETEVRHRSAQHSLRLRRQTPGLTVEEIRLVFDETYVPKEFFVAERSGGARYLFQIQTRTTDP